eukprot:CAMPEP_0184123700 /NCGR_PEP_ID=MMETSP0974-20121125/24136_1 /TAXON_ID=483370 /ORGANISM="non described non described, Strain CCMP2097" /LENGTH=58 /DNA_ID=CAMNT_0026426973 /DNA_START=43 /DNA_END=216 /DNA_ORIENTATION=+
MAAAAAAAALRCAESMAWRSSARVAADRIASLASACADTACAALPMAESRRASTRDRH